MRSAVLMQYTRVTDGRTDRQTDGIGVAYTRCSMLSCVKPTISQGSVATYFSYFGILNDMDKSLRAGVFFDAHVVFQANVQQAVLCALLT